MRLKMFGIRCQTTTSTLYSCAASLIPLDMRLLFGIYIVVGQSAYTQYVQYNNEYTLTLPTWHACVRIIRMNYCAYAYTSTYSHSVVNGILFQLSALYTTKTPTQLYCRQALSIVWCRASHTYTSTHTYAANTFSLHIVEYRTIRILAVEKCASVCFKQHERDIIFFSAD